MTCCSKGVCRHSERPLLCADFYNGPKRGERRALLRFFTKVEGITMPRFDVKWFVCLEMTLTVTLL